jgi:hypothetical protein
MVVILFPGVDLLAGYSVVSGLNNGLGQRQFTTAGGVLCALFEGSTGLVFLYVAHALGKPLVEYLRLRRKIGNSYHLPIVRRLSSLILALVMNGAFSMLNVSLSILYAILAHSKDAPVALFQIWAGLYSLAKLGLFYWQVGTIYRIENVCIFEYCKWITCSLFFSLFRFKL